MARRIAIPAFVWVPWSGALAQPVAEQAGRGGGESRVLAFLERQRVAGGAD